ncbi:hypothetical protein V1290_004426 [Bradyrhizobium sp. AZCC 1578]|uniref:hypothetical protein n=1 Tax=Bradyrhizobium sp. AZCC 1578 TaxID=3117027 RepID=UPI002FF1062A
MTRRLDYRVVGGKGLIIPTPLYVDDDLLAEIAFGDKARHWREIRHVFERQGMPGPRATVRGLYYLPAFLRFLDRREGLAHENEDYAEDGPDAFGP